LRARISWNNEAVRALLISTYDLGRQPLGLASPAGWLRRAGVDVECVDTSRDELRDEQILAAGLVAFYLPMHTATRLAAPLMERVRALHPNADLAAYGLYAPLNRVWLQERGVAHVLGPDADAELVALALEPKAQSLEPKAQSRAVAFIQPDRTSLPPLSRYAALQMPDGTRRIVGSTDATRGCKHLCRHCPIVPVYGGKFSAVPIDVVMQDIRAHVAAGAQHITFGDPDFFNGPTHARRLVEQLAGEFPRLTYDVTIKVEHLLRHAEMLPLLRRTGCLFITSAVESVDDRVLEKLLKGHTRADFVRVVGLCREAGVTLAPTFVPFTPWTTLEGYMDLIDQIEALNLIEEVAPIQLAIRLLVTAESRLLELADIRDAVESFDPQSLTWPWRHRDRRVDALQVDVMRIAASQKSRTAAFSAIAEAAFASRGQSRGQSRTLTPTLTPPYMTEAWYCCAEPGPEQFDLM
jgi:radical SAM superfamily enzyme YgiQ (UPF0313 family)